MAVSEVVLAAVAIRRHWRRSGDLRAVYGALDALVWARGARIGTHLAPARVIGMAAFVPDPPLPLPGGGGG